MVATQVAGPHLATVVLPVHVPDDPQRKPFISTSLCVCLPLTREEEGDDLQPSSLCLYQNKAFPSSWEGQPGTPPRSAILKAGGSQGRNTSGSRLKHTHSRFQPEGVCKPPHLQVDEEQPRDGDWL